MVTPPVKRRVGLSYLNSPAPLLKSIKSRTETTTAAAASTTTAAPSPKPESSIRSGRPSLKIPEPVPDDIFAPPLASSDIEDDDAAENTEVEANAESGQPFADSSDSDAPPPRGDIASTTFTSLEQKGERQTRRSTRQENKKAPPIEQEPVKQQTTAQKRKRFSDASIDKSKPKKFAPLLSSASHLLGPHGFTKQAKIKTTFGRKTSGSQGGRVAKAPEETPFKFRPPPEYNTNTPRKSWKFIVPDSSPIKFAKHSSLRHVNKSASDNEDGDEDDDDTVVYSQPRSFTDDAESEGKSTSKQKRKANPFQTKPLLLKKKGAPAAEEQDEASIPSSPPPAKFVMPAQLSDFALPDNGTGGDVREGDLSDGSSSGLSSLGSLFPDKDGDEEAGAQCPWCGATVDVKLLKEFSRGKRLNVRLQTIFCESHRKKSAMATWESKAYPKVEWASLESRFKTHRDRLLDVINGEESHYRTALADKIELGQGRSMKKEENQNPGYYGPRGFNMMCDYLVKEFSDLLKKKAVHDKVIAGRGSAAFIQSVLVAELGVQLIMEDMHVSPEEARLILEESKPLGELVNAEPEL
ncbi:RTC4-like domain-containing protein [Trichoderma chlorosporum]